MTPAKKAAAKTSAAKKAPAKKAAAKKAPAKKAAAKKAAGEEGRCQEGTSQEARRQEDCRQEEHGEEGIRRRRILRSNGTTATARRRVGPPPAGRQPHRSAGPDRRAPGARQRIGGRQGISSGVTGRRGADRRARRHGSSGGAPRSSSTRCRCSPSTCAACAPSMPAPRPAGSPTASSSAARATWSHSTSGTANCTNGCVPIRGSRISNAATSVTPPLSRSGGGWTSWWATCRSSRCGW